MEFKCLASSCLHIPFGFEVPIPIGVGVVHGSQVEASRCYTLALKEQSNVRQEVNTIERAAHASLSVVKDSRSSLTSSSTLASLPDLEGLFPPRFGSTPVGADLVE